MLCLCDVQGWKVKTSPVPIKDPYFATLKSNNYLPNALLALDAQLEGFDQVNPLWRDLMQSMDLEVHDRSSVMPAQRTSAHALQGVFVDSEGYVAEGSVMNIGIITQEGELVVPPFEQALAGCTLKRLLHLLREVVAACQTSTLAVMLNKTY